MISESFNSNSQEQYSDDVNVFARSNSKKWTAASFILISNLFEYICFFGISAILLNILITTYNWQPFNAFLIDSLFLTLYLLLALAGGLLADFLFHRILLICITYMCYLFGILGLVLLTLNNESVDHPNVPVFCKLSSHNKSDHTHLTLSQENCYPQILLLVILVSLGSGVSRVLLSVIGADQLRSSGARTVSIFFLINYMASQFGIIVVNVSLHQFDIKNQRVNYLIFLGSMLILSALFLICGRPFYEMHKHLGSYRHLLSMIQDIWKKYQTRRNVPSELHLSLVNMTKKSFGGSVEDDIVDGFKRLVNTILVFLVILPFSMQQRMVKLMDVQSKNMKIPKNLKFGSTIYSFESLVIICFVPVVLLLIFIRTNRFTVLSFSKRIIWGTLCGLLSVSISGGLETWRLNIYWAFNSTSLTPSPLSFNQTVDGLKFSFADMSVFWMALPYTLMSICEILVFITAMEYAYLTCPPWLQCSGIGLMFASWGLGSLLDDPLTFDLDGVVFNLMHINERKGYPCDKTSILTSHINDVVCWESRLDYIYYCVALVAFLLSIIIGLIVWKFFPQLFCASFMGLERRLLGENEDMSIGEEEDDDE